MTIVRDAEAKVLDFCPILAISIVVKENDTDAPTCGRDVPFERALGDLLKGYDYSICVRKERERDSLLNCIKAVRKRKSAAG